MGRISFSSALPFASARQALRARSPSFSEILGIMAERAVSKRRILIYDEHAGRIVKALGAVSPEFEILTACEREHALQFVPNAHALFAMSPLIGQVLLDASASLQWLQVLTSGIDAFADAHLRTRPIMTTMRGIHGPQMAELALMMILALKRRLPEMIDEQHRAIWNRRRQPLLAGSTIVILGTGEIAQHTARLCKGLGTITIGVTRSVRPVPGFDRVVCYEQFKDVLDAADVLLLLCPISPDTRGLVGRDILAALPRHAILINLARGGILDEAAAGEALFAGSLAGVGLDTYAEEPPPEHFPLRRMRNVIMAPHIGGFSDCYEDQAAPTLIHNIDCFSRGDWRNMRNLVSDPRCRDPGNP